MANTTEFYFGTDWESSSGPILSRAYHVADLWPQGAAGKSDGSAADTLADGLHPFLAIGPKALRGINQVGVVMSYEANTTIAELNLAPGFCAKAYVANVLTYNAGSPNTYDQSLAIGEPVYIDDSDGLADGVTLSRSPLNDDGNANPLAGYLFYDQDDYADFHVGGPNASADWPKTLANELVYTVVTVMLWPDNH